MRPSSIFTAISFLTSTILGPCIPEQAVNASKLSDSKLISYIDSEVVSPGNGAKFTVWNAKQQELQSACRVEPTSAQDVVDAIAVVTRNLCPFAVKSGGHARIADDSVSVGNVTIDQAKMKSIKVSSDQTYAKLGAGHVLYNLYSGLQNFNLTTTGVRVASVGIGRYNLGRGVSNWSPAYSIGVDNIRYVLCQKLDYKVRTLCQFISW